MGFHVDDNCNKDILQYFELDSNFKNDAKHKVFKITSLIETKLVIYEMRKCCQFTDEVFIINSKTYVNAILNYMENEKYSPFQDDEIKSWHRSMVVDEKGHNIEQKCKQVFKKFIQGTYNIGESIRKSCESFKIPKRVQKHHTVLKNSVLLYILKSV